MSERFVQKKSYWATKKTETKQQKSEAEHKISNLSN